ncbi:MAG: putative urea ABC transporter substrate-binding protein [bacterium]|nr:putative urea ABC transporter substrate-binding protein [bacterium]
MKRTLSVLCILFALCIAALQPASAKGEKKKTFVVKWSIYVGWMPWPYAEYSGILKKHAAKHGITIQLEQASYIATLNEFTARKADAVVATNMDILNMSAAAGIPCVAMIVGDYSNDNDQVLGRGVSNMQGLAGQDVLMVQGTVSQYLVARGLEMNGMREDQIVIQNTNDENQIPNIFRDNASLKALVTWNPMVLEIRQMPGVKKLFGSAQIPGEILDLMIVNKDVLDANPALGKALTGAWYETMALMQKRGKASDDAIIYMADKSGNPKASDETKLTEFRSQLATTAMFYNAADAVEFTLNSNFKVAMDRVRKFSFKNGLFGEGVKSVDDVGIQFPDGSILGNPKRIRLWFDTTYMKLAAEGKL